MTETKRKALIKLLNQAQQTCDESAQWLLGTESCNPATVADALIQSATDCREAAKEARRRVDRSLLTDADRRVLELIPRRGLRFDVPGAPPPPPRKHTFGLPVLPFSALKIVGQGWAGLTIRRPTR